MEDKDVYEVIDELIKNELENNINITHMINNIIKIFDLLFFFLVTIKSYIIVLPIFVLCCINYITTN